MIEVRNLSKAYGETRVLEDINFKVEAGEFVVVLGPSGAGKSTLLRCINRLTPPSNGEVLIDGESYPVRDKHAYRILSQRIAMVFQHHNLVDRLSVIKNVLTGRMAKIPFWACLLQLFPKQDVEAALNAIAQVGLEEKAWNRADNLSGGQQQRVGIARALAQEPDLILADEPVASLDPKTSRQILGYIREVSRKNNIAVLCNLHQIDYAMEFGQRIIGISGGHIVFNGKPEELTPEIVAQIYPGLEDEGIAKLVSRTAEELRRKKAGAPVLKEALC
ncbi:phosphonate ABC transporter ATP-binding protein [Shewanella algae]|uniref:phosphonate ABC transporter ATP-binding protein n=1 Tax=Shewanella algae TaxID=38313 RepID=UPI0031F50BF4